MEEKIPQANLLPPPVLTRCKSKVATFCYFFRKTLQYISCQKIGYNLKINTATLGAVRSAGTDFEQIVGMNFESHATTFLGAVQSRLHYASESWWTHNFD